MLDLDRYLDIDTIYAEVHKQLMQDVPIVKKKKTVTPWSGWSNEKHTILQFTKDGQFVKEWKSAAEAAKATNITSIGCCVSGATKSAGGYVWKYKHPDIDRSRK